LEESGCGLIKALSPHFPGEIEEKHKIPFRIADVSAKI
jgi:hypothetical protein